MCIQGLKKSIVRKEKCFYKALSLPMGAQECSGYCAQCFRGDSAECLWFNVEIYILKNIRGLSLAQQRLFYRKTECCAITRYSTRWTCLCRGIRGMETELGGFGRKMLLGFSSWKIFICMCKHQSTCLPADTVRNAHRLGLQDPSVCVPKGKDGVSDCSSDRREAG